MKEARLQQLRADECREIRKAAKVAKTPPPYEIPESRTKEESKVDGPKADLKTSQYTTTPIRTPINTVQGNAIK